jgi:hypothetical protein
MKSYEDLARQIVSYEHPSGYQHIIENLSLNKSSFELFEENLLPGFEKSTAKYLRSTGKANPLSLMFVKTTDENGKTILKMNKKLEDDPHIENVFEFLGKKLVNKFNEKYKKEFKDKDISVKINDYDYIEVTTRDDKGKKVKQTGQIDDMLERTDELGDAFRKIVAKRSEKCLEIDKNYIEKAFFLGRWIEPVEDFYVDAKNKILNFKNKLEQLGDSVKEFDALANLIELGRNRTNIPPLCSIYSSDKVDKAFSDKESLFLFCKVVSDHLNTVAGVDKGFKPFIEVDEQNKEFSINLGDKKYSLKEFGSTFTLADVSSEISARDDEAISRWREERAKLKNREVEDYQICEDCPMQSITDDFFPDDPIDKDKIKSQPETNTLKQIELDI